MTSGECFVTQYLDARSVGIGRLAIDIPKTVFFHSFPTPPSNEARHAMPRFNSQCVLTNAEQTVYLKHKSTEMRCRCEVPDTIINLK
jgi:hypothetical protein